MKIAYGIESLTMKENNAVSLYYTIQTYLHSRLLEKPLTKEEELNRAHRNYAFKKGYRVQAFQKRNIWN
jgi:hypothetical protein